MKKILLFGFLAFCSLLSIAQSGTFTPNGLWIPQVSLASNTANAGGQVPSNGQMVFNTNDNIDGGTGIYRWTTNKWVKIETPKSAIVLSTTYPNNHLDKNGYGMVGQITSDVRPLQTSNIFAGIPWSATSVPLTIGRSGHTATMAGDKMIIWGGSADLSPFYFNDGLILNTESNTWSSMATPSLGNRDGHTAVWTGSKLIVWGGYGNPTGMVSDYQYYGNGAVYDPATNTWTAMSSAGAPSARSGHTAIWTGSRMIVWGGTSYIGGGFVDYNDGYSYNLGSNTWTTISAASLAGRSGHSAVWTGTQMLIWGGGQAVHFGTATCYNNGQIYNPTSNTWTSMTSSSAPSVRQGHATVWTGTKMVVWGGANTGVNPATKLATGGVYDFANNSWSATTATNAPTERFGHEAAWDGNTMRIFGGNHSSGNNYAEYDPAQNSWTLFFSAFPFYFNSYPTGEPVARIGHTAVWNGYQFIVWGGTRLSDNSKIFIGARLSDLVYTKESQKLYMYQKQ